MATRRPASSRARVNTNTNSMPPPQQQQQPRSRSVMSRSASSTRPPDNNSIQERTPAHTPKDESEINIQVVIRCRRRSEREIQDNSPIIVTSNGAKSKDVSVEASAPVSSLGLVTLPPLRTYPFDLVFGPEADQAMIYHDVVSPMLDEVLTGYNCTLFAYGQTGTGKTYTMQGDLTPTPMGNPSPNAGMIPRVLFRLFHHLETSKTDYSVRISYIELYNEELRDLLANDLSAPMGSAQPMGLASKDGNKNGENGLKIFDDAGKRGVMIQGLEEIAVKDSRDALALLTKGSHRRQIAATKFNDHSSRSHSVFSITIHIKETSTLGEDLLKIGKLNLVDLAGSENIGRSGAENKRAREAGMINQSLLTLGRVINALVDKAQHIPYRESKLTRLLQDSLGGRTKTCIIATISPARSNMEETLSTLDYAIRAKSIRNKPEINQRMTRNSLLKEYVAEIEHLKADLLAAREKNGIFFSEETWNQMTIDQELRTTELEEAKKQVSMVETQMRGVREEFEQSIGLLKIREGELRESQAKLRNTEVALQRKEDELITVKSTLEEEVVVRKAHQDTEVDLDSIANGLKKVAKQSVQDIERLFEKLERKAIILNQNSHAVMTHGRIISTTGRTLSQKLDQFLNFSSQTSAKLQDRTLNFQTKELEALASYSEGIDQQLQHVQTSLGVIQGKDASEDEALNVAQKILGETHQTFKMGLGAFSETYKQTCHEMTNEMKLTGVEAFSVVEAALRAMASLVEAVISENQEYLDTESETIREAKTLASDTSKFEIVRLRQHNETLGKLLESERHKTDRAKDEMIQRISGLLCDFTKERDRELREAVGLIQTENKEAEDKMISFSKKHDEIIEQMGNNSAEMIAKLKRRGGEGKRARDGSLKTLAGASATFSEELDAMQNTMSGSITSYSTQVQTQTDKMAISCTNAFESHSRAKRARVEATASMSAEVVSEYHCLKQGIASSSRNVETSASQILSQTSELAGLTKTYGSATLVQLESLHEASEALTTEGAHVDLPTGSTPRKRTWDYVDNWKLTSSREALLQSWRGPSTPGVGGGNFLAEHLPLPEADDDPLDEDTDVITVPGPESPTEPDCVSIPTKLVTKKAAGHRKGVPSLGTLTDSRNIYTTRGSRRAR